MSNKEKLFELILSLSNEDAERLLNHVLNEKRKREQAQVETNKYHRIIYSIKHNGTGKEYIGITKNLEKRIEAHKAALRRGKHLVEDMQTDFDKYGDDYTVTVLEEITDYSQTSREYELMRDHESYLREKGYNYNDHVFKRKKMVK